MRREPKEAWEAIRMLEKGSKSHHGEPTDDYTLQDSNTGQIATNPKDNVAILKQYCTKLYNRDDAPVDRTVLEDIEQMETMDHWNNQDITFTEWQTAQLKWLYKKGDRKNPSNYRGIVLQDIVARVMSTILTTRLQKILQQNGIEEQFGSQPGRGTIDALFVKRLALQLRREDQQDSYVLFVDLIKAFNTANHDLLFALTQLEYAKATTWCQHSSFS